MRVCSIITSFTSGGAEVLVSNLAEQFCAMGHEATVLALSDAIQLGNGLETEAAMIRQVNQAGGSALSLGLANRNAWIKGARALRRVLRAERPDVIHSHTARALPLIALARPGVPVILTHHNSRLSFPPAAFHLFNQVVDGYVAISAECERILQRHTHRPVRVIWNAANPRFQMSTPRRAVPRDVTILAVGTVSEQKDYPTLVRAARLLAAALAPMGRRPRICVAGGGPMLEDLRTFVANLGAGDYVHLLDVRHDVDRLMRDADIFVNCSLWEGFPIALIEAAMSGLPIVATDVAGNAEMVVPGVNGSLVPPGDAEALASAIAAALSNDAAYSRLSEGSLESASRFSIDRCANAHLALYDEMRAQAAASRSASHITRPREFGASKGL